MPKPLHLQLGNDLPNEDGYYWVNDPEENGPKVVEVVVLRGNAYALIDDTIVPVAGCTTKEWGKEPIPEPTTHTPKVPVQKTTFGQLDPGDHFTNSAHEADNDTGYAAIEDSILNVKLRDRHDYRTDRGPFNVVCLEDGRPRTFRDEETVYKADNDGRLHPA